MTLIAFDFGMKRIGVAVGQTISHTASPLPVLAAKDGMPQWQVIDSLFEEWTPSKVIVGLPLNMDGTQQPITFAAKKFGQRVAHRYHLPVEFVDERLTTVEAKQLTSNKLTSLDSIAATLILETWLRENHNEN